MTAEQPPKAGVGVPPKGFVESAALIHHAHHQGFPAAGRRGGQGEHVVDNDVRFGRGERKVRPGVIQGPARMVEAVELVGAVGGMPVVEKIVVEQRTAHQALFITADAQQTHQFSAEIGHCQTVEQYGGIAVLDGLARKPKAGTGEKR